MNKRSDPDHQWTDDELREELRLIDEADDIDVTKFEAEFIDSVVYRYKRALSAKQRDVAVDIIDTYREI